MLLKDLEETERRGFEDKRSYVRNDGSEVLKGRDWTARKREIWERGGGKCEQMVECNERTLKLSGASIAELLAGKQRCRNEMHDPHHIKPRSKGRDDRAANLIGLCRMHHDLLDERKPKWRKDFAESLGDA